MSWFDKEKPSTPPPAVEAPPTVGKITDLSKDPAIDAALAHVRKTDSHV